MRVEPSDIPPELIQILNDRAGKAHSTEGSVVSCLAEILTHWEELRGGVTPMEMSHLVQDYDSQRAVELQLAAKHAERGHTQSWRRTDSISQGTGYLLVVVCSCQAEFYVARVGRQEDTAF